MECWKLWPPLFFPRRFQQYRDWSPMGGAPIPSANRNTSSSSSKRKVGGILNLAGPKSNVYVPRTTWSYSLLTMKFFRSQVVPHSLKAEYRSRFKDHIGSTFFSRSGLTKWRSSKFCRTGVKLHRRTFPDIWQVRKSDSILFKLVFILTPLSALSDDLSPRCKALHFRSCLAWSREN